MRRLAGRDAAAALLGAVLGAAVSIALGRSPLATAIGASAVGALVLAAAIDARERRVPNALSYGMTATVLLIAAISGHVADAVVGGGVALATMLALLAVSRGTLGLGDVKLAMAVGALLGPAGVPAFVFASTIAGATAAAWLLLRGHHRHTTMPYAPALGIGGVFALFTTTPLLG